MFLIIQTLNINFKKLSFSLILSATLSSILGLYQFFTQTAFSSKLLGLSDHLAWQGGSSVIATESFRFLRAYGSLSHPNIMGGLLAIVLLLSLGAYLKASRSELRWKMFLVATLPLNFLALLTTFSRSALLALLIGVILIVFYFLFKEKLPRKKDLWVIFYAIIILTVLFLTAYADLFSSRTQNETRLEKKSIADRKIYLQDAQQIIRQNPFLGVGPGNYTSTVLKDKKNSRKIWEIQPVHNLYLLVFSEIGFWGFIFFFSFVAIIISEISEKIKNRKSDATLFSFLLITLLFLALFDHWLWTGAFGIILFWLILALSEKESLFI
ncbi:MAG: O-antigen ligase family protein [Candidatus Moraniibacteriota bacterium]